MTDRLYVIHENHLGERRYQPRLDMGHSAWRYGGCIEWSWGGKFDRPPCIAPAVARSELPAKRCVAASASAGTSSGRSSMTDRELCWECIARPDPNRENGSSGYCPLVCDDCGGCVYCDGSC